MALHECVKCGRTYTSDVLVSVSSCVCGSSTFRYIHDEGKKTKPNSGSDVKVIDRGVFELNINSLAQKEPVIIEGEDGVFFIKFPKRKKRS